MNRLKRRRNKNKKKNRYLLFVSLCSFLFCILSFIIIGTNYLNPKFDYVTSNYISFKDSFSTDSLKIRYLEVMSDKKGISNSNSSNVSFNVDGNKSFDYKLILYSIGNKIDSKYVKICIVKNDKVVFINTLDKFNNIYDNGIVVYEDKISGEDKFKVYMWISKKYSGNCKNTSFEMKVK